jgi:hypothetical protein
MSIQEIVDLADVEAIAKQVGKMLDGRDLRNVMTALICLLAGAVASIKDDEEFRGFIKEATRLVDLVVTDRFGPGGTA